MSLKCLLCGWNGEPKDRQKHLKIIHGLDVMDARRYSLFGVEGEEHTIETASDGICGECTSYLGGIRILSIIKYNDIYYEVLCRCAVCGALQLSDSLEELGMINPCSYDDDKDEHESDISISSPSVLIYKGANCTDCQFLKYNAKNYTFICMGYDTEVFIDQKALSIAECCEMFDAKSIPKKNKSEPLKQEAISK